MVHLVVAPAQVRDANDDQLRLVAWQPPARHELARVMQPAAEQAPRATERAEQVRVVGTRGAESICQATQLIGPSSRSRPGEMRGRSAETMLGRHLRVVCAAGAGAAEL